jgi:hypothetical protein
MYKAMTFFILYQAIGSVCWQRLTPPVRPSRTATLLFGCAGKRVKKLILNFQFPLSNEVEERDGELGKARVSLSLS